MPQHFWLWEKVSKEQELLEALCLLVLFMERHMTKALKAEPK